MVAIKDNLGPAPNCLSTWLRVSSADAAVRGGKPEDARENGCGKRNITSRVKPKGRALGSRS